MWTCDTLRQHGGAMSQSKDIFFSTCFSISSPLIASHWSVHHSCIGTLPRVISEVPHILSLFDFKDMQRNQLCLTLLYDMLLHEYDLGLWGYPPSKSMFFASVKTKKEVSDTERKREFSKASSPPTNAFRDLCSQLIRYLKWNPLKAVSLP